MKLSLSSLIVAWQLVGGAMASDQYVTRFENQETVSYSLDVQMVEKIVAKQSWNPFRRTTSVERKMVPVVRWLPNRTQQTTPITQRIRSQDSSRLAKIEPQKLAPQETRAMDLRPVAKSASRNGKSTNDVRNNFRTEPVNSKLNTNQYGGVQRLDRNNPRYGMKLRSESRPARY